MSGQYLGLVPPSHVPASHAEDDAILTAPHGLDSEGYPRHGQDFDASAPASATAKDVEDARALAQMAREQLARDIADIERATAALRLAEPALQSWSKPATPAAPKPRPLWLLIGVLWLSTAIVTAGAVVAIAALAG